MNEKNDLPPDLEKRWREWSRTEPAIDERQLRRNVLERIPEPRPLIRPRLVLAAAAASLVALVVSFETLRSPSIQPVDAAPEMVYETGEDVILVLREGADPMYVLTESSRQDGTGEMP